MSLGGRKDDRPKSGRKAGPNVEKTTQTKKAKVAPKKKAAQAAKSEESASEVKGIIIEAWYGCRQL